MEQLSFWEKESFFAPQDIIIAGSGFVGLWSAFYLKTKNPTYKITVLERGLIPTGASTRNAGFSCFGSPSEILGDARLMGEEKMWQLVTMRYKGLSEIRKYFNDADIDYDACGGYECFTKQSEDWEECTDKLEWLNNQLKLITGETALFKTADKKISDFGFNGFGHLVENRLEAGLQPAKLLQALLQKVQSLGVQVITGITVAGYQNNVNGIEVDAQITGDKNGHLSLKCRQLLICTNAFTKKLLPSVDIVPNRGQVLITAPINNLAIRGTFHFDKGYYYFRNVGDRLLLGGARNVAFGTENTDVMEVTDVVQTTLIQFIQQHLLPGTDFTITDKWSGIMAMGSEKMPLIKAIEPNVFCCARMSGMGVALAPMAAMEVAALMMDK